MDSRSLIALLELSFFSFLANIPLGAWRNSVKKFSWQWFVAVHLCVPLIFILRRQAGLGLKVIPVLVMCSLLGHFVGGSIGIRAIRRVKNGIALMMGASK